MRILSTVIRLGSFLMIPVLVFGPAQAEVCSRAAIIRFAKDAKDEDRSFTGSLTPGRERAFTFRGDAGDRVRIVNPRSSAFDVRIYHEASGFDTEFDSSRTFEVDLPADGDYQLIVRRKMGGPRGAVRFNINFSIKRTSGV